MRNKIFNEECCDIDIKRRDRLRAEGKNDPHEKIDWEHITTMACLAVCIMAGGFVILNITLTFGALAGLLAGMFIFIICKVLSFLIG